MALQSSDISSAASRIPSSCDYLVFRYPMDPRHFPNVNERFLKLVPDPVEERFPSLYEGKSSNIHDLPWIHASRVGTSNAAECFIPDEVVLRPRRPRRWRCRCGFPFCWVRLQDGGKRRPILYTVVAVLLFFFLLLCWTGGRATAPRPSETSKPAQGHPSPDPPSPESFSAPSSIPFPEEQEDVVDSPSSDFVAPSSSPSPPSRLRGPEKTFTTVLSLTNTGDRKEAYQNAVLRVAKEVYRGGMTRHPHMYEFLVCVTIQKKEASELEKNIRDVWRKAEEEENSWRMKCPRCFSNEEIPSQFSPPPPMTSHTPLRTAHFTSFPPTQDIHHSGEEHTNTHSEHPVHIRVHSAGSYRSISQGKLESASHLLLKCVTTVKSDYFIILSNDWHPIAEKELDPTALFTSSPLSVSSISINDAIQQRVDSMAYTQRVLDIALQTLSSNRAMEEPLLMDMGQPWKSAEAHVFKLKHYAYTLSPTPSLPASMRSPSFPVVFPAYDEMENQTSLDHELHEFFLDVKARGVAQENSPADTHTQATASVTPVVFSPSFFPNQEGTDSSGTPKATTSSASPSHDEGKGHPTLSSKHVTIPYSKGVLAISVDWRSLPSSFYGVNRVYHCHMAPFYNIRRFATPLVGTPHVGEEEQEKEGTSRMGTEHPIETEKIKENRNHPVQTKQASAVRYPSKGSSSTSPFSKTTTVCELLTASRRVMHSTFMVGPVLHFYQTFCGEWRKLVSPLREEVVNRSQDLSVLEEERDMTTSLCAFEWLRTFKKEEGKVIEKMKAKKKKAEERKKFLLGRPLGQGNASMTSLSLLRSNETVFRENAGPSTASLTPLQQFAAAAMDDDVFQAGSPFILALNETSRWDSQRKSFMDSRKGLQQLVENTTLKEVYWNTSHQLRAENRWKDPSQEVICLPSNKVLWDSTPAMYRTSWFVQSIIFSCFQRGTLCIDKGSPNDDFSMRKLGRYLSFAGKWGKGGFQICFTGGGTHFFNSS